ncbi:endonuclease/exonuclease/phosphatase [Anopheles sinensis]|uniref:Endonuclease/exonuclease/phosphatase n=1 Tax=Anopheles sinensis TaxID=74873 RepID=A0A084VN37_ANOSI|nr:endonuclease/exonuclease/phosphatase [Anopheles sinensis]
MAASNWRSHEQAATAPIPRIQFAKRNDPARWNGRQLGAFENEEQINECLKVRAVLGAALTCEITWAALVHGKPAFWLGCTGTGVSRVGVCVCTRGWHSLISGRNRPALGIRWSMVS